MSSMLKEWLNKKIRIVSTDGCTYTAKFLAFDAKTNLILEDVWEIQIPSEEDYEDGERTNHRFKGNQVFRGENVVLVGVVDEEMEGQVDWSGVKGELGTTKH